MPLELKIRTPDNENRRLALDRSTLTLGRATGNDLCYPDDASLSRRHLRIEPDADGWSVTDLDSKNGTLLNGGRITETRRLKAGDRISAGQISLTVVEQGAEDEVVFVAGAGPELLPSATVMTSLEGVLSSQSTIPRSRPGAAPPGSREVFELPAVRALIRAGRELAGVQPLAELFQLILDLSIEAVEAERGVLLTLEGTKLVTRAVSGEGLRISTLVRDRVLNDKASILVRDIAQEEALRERHSISSQQIHSLMAVPLQTENHVIGLVYVDSRLFVREFTPEDLSLLTVLANVAAIRIEHERFLQMERQEQRRTRDLQQAAEIQRSILPARAPALAGFELVGYNAPSRTVGGDYYDFLHYADGRVAVLLGDVAGKGMSAALLMSSLQARVQLLAVEAADLGLLMSRLDRSLGGNLPDNRFITMFACIIDPSSGEVTYSNAGHNPPLLVAADGTVSELPATGPVLGLGLGASYAQRAVRLGVGDTLAIYSDGVTEATSTADEEYGVGRLRDLLLARRTSSAADVMHELTEAVEAWAGGEAQADDVTIVIVRRVAAAGAGT